MSISKNVMLSVLGVSTLAVGAIAGLVVSSNAQVANTYSSVDTNVNTQMQRNRPDREAVKNAIEKGDYEAWKTAMKNDPRGNDLLTKIDTQEKFNKFVEMHKAVQSGDTAKAESLRNELGLPTAPNREKNDANRKAEQDALSKSDYEAWKAAVKNNPNGTLLLEKVNTQEKFAKLVEAHNYQEKAKAIREELGLPTRPEGKGDRGGRMGGKGGMMGNGVQNNQNQNTQNNQNTL